MSNVVSCAWCCVLCVTSEQVEEKTEVAWLGHPEHMIFDNSTDLDGKIERMTAAASRLVGLPCPPGKWKKFLLVGSAPAVSEFPVPVAEAEAEKVMDRVLTVPK